MAVRVPLLVGRRRHISCGLSLVVLVVVVVIVRVVRVWLRNAGRSSSGHLVV